MSNFWIKKFDIKSEILSSINKISLKTFKSKKQLIFYYTIKTLQDYENEY